MIHLTPPDWNEPTGAYTSVVSDGSLVFVAGQIGVDQTTGTLAGEELEAQVVQALDNVGRALEAGGSSLANALKVTVYLAHFHRDFAEFDRLYAQIVPAPRPVRTTIGATVPAGLIEIDAIGRRRDARASL